MDNLYIRIPTPGGLWQAWAIKDQAAVPLTVTDLEAIMAAHAANVRVTVLLPTSACILTQINITRQQLKQMQEDDLAYLLEDQTLTSVEQLHCQYQSINDSQALVLGIQQTLLQSLIEPFKANGCQLVAAIPDIFMVPHNEQGWSLMVDGSDCWLRVNSLFGLRLEAMAAMALLDCAWQEAPVSHVRVYGEVPSDIQAWLTAKGDALTIDVVPAFNWSQEFGQLNGKHPFNVLKGKFAVKTSSSLSGYWRYAAIFVGITFAVQLAYDTTRLMHFNRVAKNTKAESVKLYKSLFPEEQRIVNLRRQIETHLAEHQQQGQGFMPIATKVGEVLNNGSWQTQRLDYDTNGLLLEVDAASLSDLEQLRQQLSSQGLTTETLSANSQGTAIRGRLRISENS